MRRITPYMLVPKWSDASHMRMAALFALACSEKAFSYEDYEAASHMAEVFAADVRIPVVVACEVYDNGYRWLDLSHHEYGKTPELYLEPNTTAEDLFE